MKCMHNTAKGQCKNEALDGEKYCEKHKRKNKNYRLVSQYRVNTHLLGDAPERHSNTSEIKSLHGEIALIKSLLESRLNMVESEAELVAAMPQIKDFALAVEKLATACHNMDVKLGNLLDKQTLVSLAQDLIMIIERNVRPLADAPQTSEEIDSVIERIADELLTTIKEKTNEV